MLAQLTHRQELENLIFDVLETVVILLENLRGLLEIERLLNARIPRQLRDRLEVGANYLGFHGFPTSAFQARQLAIHFLARRFRQLERIEPLLQIVRLGRLFFFAELLADSLHLLAQQHLALTLAQFFLDLSLNVFLSVEHRDLALHVDEHPTQPVFDRNGFEQLLALARLDVEMSRDEIRQGTRVRNALQHLLHDLIG